MIKQSISAFILASVLTVGITEVSANAASFSNQQEQQITMQSETMMSNSKPLVKKQNVKEKQKRMLKKVRTKK